MDQASSLEELATRKRLIQAKMDIHRAEMAIHYDHLKRPIQSVKSTARTIFSNPWLRWAIFAGLGLFLVKGGGRSLRSTVKVTGKMVPFVFPRVRNFLISQATQWGMRWFRKKFVSNRD